MKNYVQILHSLILNFRSGYLNIFHHTHVCGSSYNKNVIYICIFKFPPVKSFFVEIEEKKWKIDDSREFRAKA